MSPLRFCCLLLFIGVAATRFDLTNSARILGFFPSPSKSHLIIHAAIADALAEAGHNVTVYGASKNVIPKAKYKYIELEPKTNESFVAGMAMGSSPSYKQFGKIVEMIASASNDSLTHPRVQRLLREHGSGDFDLVIVGYFMNDATFALAAHFQCPLIVSFMIQPIMALNSLIGNPTEIAYTPTMLGKQRQPMNFVSRVKNFISVGMELLMAELGIHFQTKIYDYNFPSDRYPPLDEVRKNVSLIFTNHHFSQGPIRPNVPNLIEIGGIQIKEKPDPLPTDIAKVLDESKEGVIYFSLGSNIKGSHLNEEKIKIMFNVISKLPYKVLWKWSPTELPGESKNIIFRDWLPQDDILAHPNIKLFITHGGMGSVVESQYHGVPMVGIPLFGDQPSNMVNVERSGYGLAVDYLTLTEESLNNAIQDVLNNPKYKEAVQTFSRLYRDRPMTPRETVVYWVDYVLRHKGAKHMQSPAVHMNRWQLLSLDVIGFLLAIVLTISVVIVKVCKLICCRGRKNKLPKVEKAKQN
ncbi:UDP-glycosyltransferase UGT5-like isoform X5 [Bactrocera neohumeralis]|uniref:UDP-glycosyltransferase UGT5-like isoform X5 n=1 Tax=Bactrocera neohumeralis TaxID=98809 RepID=UPI00216697D3|nr:UDP-glycosyltransferase UGT5-like isoform X5 [Bactrocera neohumeralis]